MKTKQTEINHILQMLMSLVIRVLTLLLTQFNFVIDADNCFLLLFLFLFF